MSIVLLPKENYLAAINNSLDSKLFRNSYADVDGEKKDILENGGLSCAYFASSILYLFKLTRDVHSTVSGTVQDLENSGWIKIDAPKEGCVLVWSEIDFGHGPHRHVGFYVGNSEAISNNHLSGMPSKHDWQFGKQRNVEAIYWNPILDNKA